MAADLKAMRQEILAQLDQCTALAYSAGSHFAQHGKHAPSLIMKQADADGKLVHLIEEYAQSHAAGVKTADGWRTSADGLTRTRIAPDAASPMVLSARVTLVMGPDGRLKPKDDAGVLP